MSLDIMVMPWLCLKVPHDLVQGIPREAAQLPKAASCTEAAIRHSRTGERKESFNHGLWHPRCNLVP
jgi:hypothetical protein